MILLNFFGSIINWYMSNMSYLTIMILMTIESTFIPLPSELVLPPAGWQVAQGEMNFFLVVLFSSLGCLLGALINYTLSYYLGRAIIYRLADSKAARIFFINRAKLERAEKYFNDNGNSSTFIGRLVPGIRHLISIPAGLAKMDIKKFILFTIIGSTLWNTILTTFGYFFGKNQDVLMQHFQELKYAAYALGAIFILYLIYKGKNHKKKA